MGSRKKVEPSLEAVDLYIRVFDIVSVIVCNLVYENKQNSTANLYYLIPELGKGKYLCSIALYNGNKCIGKSKVQVGDKFEYRPLNDSQSEEYENENPREIVNDYISQNKIGPFPMKKNETWKIEIIIACTLVGKNEKGSKKAVLKLAKSFFEERHSNLNSISIKSNIKITSYSTPKNFLSNWNHILSLQKNDYCIYSTQDNNKILQNKSLKISYCDEHIIDPIMLLQKHNNGWAGIISFLPRDESKYQSQEIFLVLDRSGSMYGERIKLAVKATQLFLSSLHSGSNFNIISYGTIVKPMFDTTVPYNDHNKNEAMNKTYSIDADMEENDLYSALELIYDQLEKSTLPGVIFLITDGGEPTYDNSLNLVKKNKNKCTVYGLPINTCGDDLKFVQDAAILGGGKYYHIVNEQQITEKLIEFVGLSNCHFIYDLKLPTEIKKYSPSSTYKPRYAYESYAFICFTSEKEPQNSISYKSTKDKIPHSIGLKKRIVEDAHLFQYYAKNKIKEITAEIKKESETGNSLEKINELKLKVKKIQIKNHLHMNKSKIIVVSPETSNKLSSPVIPNIGFGNKIDHINAQNSNNMLPQFVEYSDSSGSSDSSDSSDAIEIIYFKEDQVLESNPELENIFPECCKRLTRKVRIISESCTDIINLQKDNYWEFSTLKKVLPGVIIFNMKFWDEDKEDCLATLFVLAMLEVHWISSISLWKKSAENAIKWLINQNFDYYGNYQPICKEIVISIYSTATSFPSDILDLQLNKKFNMLLALLKLRLSTHWSSSMIQLIFPNYNTLKWKKFDLNPDIRITIFVFVILKLKFAEFQDDWESSFLISERWMKDNGIILNDLMEEWIKNELVVDGSEKKLKEIIECDNDETMFIYIISKACIDGHWDYNEVKQDLSCILRNYKEPTNSFDSNIFCTLCIVHTLRTRFRMMKKQYKLLISKSLTWLKGNNIDYSDNIVSHYLESIFSYSINNKNFPINYDYHFALAIFLSNGNYWEYNTLSMIFKNATTILNLNNDIEITVGMFKYIWVYFPLSRTDFKDFNDSVINWLLLNIQNFCDIISSYDYACVLKIPNSEQIQETLNEEIIYHYENSDDAKIIDYSIFSVKLMNNSQSIYDNILKVNYKVDHWEYDSVLKIFPQLHLFKTRIQQIAIDKDIVATLFIIATIELYCPENKNYFIDLCKNSEKWLETKGILIKDYLVNCLEIVGFLSFGIESDSFYYSGGLDDDLYCFDKFYYSDNNLGSDILKILLKLRFANGWKYEIIVLIWPEISQITGFMDEYDPDLKITVLIIYVLREYFNGYEKYWKHITQSVNKWITSKGLDPENIIEKCKNNQAVNKYLSSCFQPSFEENVLKIFSERDDGRNTCIFEKGEDEMDDYFKHIEDELLTLYPYFMKIVKNKIAFQSLCIIIYLEKFYKHKRNNIKYWLKKYKYSCLANSCEYLEYLEHPEYPKYILKPFLDYNIINIYNIENHLFIILSLFNGAYWNMKIIKLVFPYINPTDYDLDIDMNIDAWITIVFIKYLETFPNGIISNFYSCIEAAKEWLSMKGFAYENYYAQWDFYEVLKIFSEYELKEIPEECKLLTRKVVVILDEYNKIKELFGNCFYVLWKDTIISFPALLLFDFRLSMLTLPKNLIATIFIITLLKVQYIEIKSQWQEKYASAIKWLEFNSFDYYNYEDIFIEIVISIFSTSQVFPNLNPERLDVKMNFELLLVLLKLHSGNYWSYHSISSFLPSIEKCKFSVGNKNINAVSTLYVLTIFFKYFEKFRSDWNYIYLLSKKWLSTLSIDADEEIEKIISTENSDLVSEKSEFSESLYNEIIRIFNREGFFNFEQVDQIFWQLSGLIKLYENMYTNDALATLFILYILETKYPKKRLEWETIEDRSKNWLKERGIILRFNTNLFENFRSAFCYKVIQSQFVLSKYDNFILVFSVSNGIYWEFSVVSQLFCSLGFYYYKNFSHIDPDAFTTIVIIKYLEEYYIEEISEWNSFKTKVLYWLENIKNIKYIDYVNMINCSKILKLPSILSERDALINSEVITAKFMFDHLKYEYAVCLIPDCESYFDPYMRKIETEKQELCMTTLLKIAQNSISSQYTIFEISEQHMQEFYTMTNLFFIYGSIADIKKDLISFCFNYKSRIDLKKITSYFLLEKITFSLFSAIVQKGKINLYIGKTRNFWIINSPLLKKNKFESLGEALLWVVKQGFTLKIINYYKNTTTEDETIFTNIENEDIENYRIDAETNSSEKNVCFSKETYKIAIEKYFDKVREKCTCELCESIVESGKSYSKFKKLLVN
ncbi:hypothetical protein SteCoe_12551 [Stentor coeruleus]|uniref:VWFA domain-containing protein n=1 Tax=Stentor coeruleus TaxID=5963 RepID=A0A1R2CAK3_9CILI|nr:hypothetical protein SteCoe_12551 [Stentor coeruleus]